MKPIEARLIERRCLWSLGCQARRAPQDFCTVRNPEARDEPGFKSRFFPFLTTFAVYYVNSSGVEVGGAGRSVVLSGARAGLWCFLARHARAWVKNLTFIPSNQKTTPFFKTSCIFYISSSFILDITSLAY